MGFSFGDGLGKWGKLGVSKNVGTSIHGWTRMVMHFMQLGSEFIRKIVLMMPKYLQVTICTYWTRRMLQRMKKSFWAAGFLRASGSSSSWAPLPEPICSAPTSSFFKWYKTKLTDRLVRPLAVSDAVLWLRVQTLPVVKVRQINVRVSRRGGNKLRWS